MGIGQTNETEMLVLPKPIRQTKNWVLNIPNRLKLGYWPDRTNQNMGFAQREQTATRNKAINQTKI